MMLVPAYKPFLNAYRLVLTGNTVRRDDEQLVVKLHNAIFVGVNRNILLYGCIQCMPFRWIHRR